MLKWGLTWTMEKSNILKFSSFLVLKFFRKTFPSPPSTGPKKVLKNHILVFRVTVNMCPIFSLSKIAPPYYSALSALPPLLPQKASNMQD